MNDNWTNSIINQWNGVQLNRPATIETITQAEAVLGYMFPEDFKELYLKVDGFVGGWLPNMFTIWPIELILEYYDREENKDYVGFSDYMANSHQIGFLKSKPGVYVLYGEVPDKVADTFSEAIQLINADSDKIY